MTEFLEPFERMLTLLFPADRVRAIDAGAEWQHEREEVEQSGFLDALVPETAGGAGVSLADAAQLWRALGRNAAPIAIVPAAVTRCVPRCSTTFSRVTELLEYFAVASCPC